MGLYGFREGELSMDEEDRLRSVTVCFAYVLGSGCGCGIQ